MGNSNLVSYTKISPHKTVKRNHAIDTVTIHCYVGQVSVERMGDGFANPLKKASCNYGIGSDGRIGMYVEEKDCSWCSSNTANDRRAITIECASDTKHPYTINDKVYKSLINLLVDICLRNGIKELKWKGDKSLIGHPDKQNMTVHRWFANKSCPGDYIYNRLGVIADEVNLMLQPKLEPGFKVTVSVSALRIRTGPGTNYSAARTFIPKGVYTIVDVQPGQGSDKGWGKLKSGAGWIALDFVKMKV